MNAQVVASHAVPTLVSPLEGTRFELRVRDLVGDLVVRQRYVNRRAEPIEALFTFPMAMDATFLGMDVRIGDKVMSGSIAARGAARAQYEEAVARGDAGILLERHAADLYTANLGNVNPGESVELSIRFGMLLRPADGQLRLRLPTTIAPRYGRSPLEPQDAPEADLFIEHRFALEASIEGLLARAEVSCPTHACAIERHGAETSLSIDGDSAFLDRDIVVRFDGVVVPPLTAFTTTFDGRSVMLAVVQVPAAETKVRKPLSVAILVDCSGSMLGDSIRLARQGLAAALGELGEGDRFTILRFGSSLDPMFDALVPAVETNLRRAQIALAGMEANLGGTEMGAALDAALDALDDGAPGDRIVYLLSDGETHAAKVDAVVRRACALGIRLFTVGVGAAPVEAVMRPLAERTSGSVEYVAPGEAMAPRIERHFARMRRGLVGRLSIACTETWRWTAVPTGVGAGETVWVAGERMETTGESVAVRIGEGVSIDAACTAVSGPDGEVLARLGAALRLAEPTLTATPVSFALRYRLLTSDTSCVLVVPRAEGDRAEVLPTTVKVPQMLAAGWSGSAQVAGMSVDNGGDLNMCMLEDEEDMARRGLDLYRVEWSKMCRDLSAEVAVQALAAAVSALGRRVDDNETLLAWLRVIEAEGLHPRPEEHRYWALWSILLKRVKLLLTPDPLLVAAIATAVSDRGLHARLVTELIDRTFPPGPNDRYFLDEFKWRNGAGRPGGGAG